MEPNFIPLAYRRVEPREVLRRARAFYEEMNQRRSVRFFSPEPVPREALELAIRTAGTAPSGANQQPWTFVVVGDPALKARMRAAAEQEEREFYSHRAPADWLDAVRPLGTDFHKAHITDAPYVVVLFKQGYGVDGARERRVHYYATESCGIAAGLFIAAVHRMGLATLPHTPSPMGFLADLLGRPAHERPFLLLPVGYPARDARVPALRRKALEEISVWME